MNRLLFIGLLLLTITACKKTNGLLFSDANRLEMADTVTMSNTFVYESANVTRDTVYIQVNTIGHLTNYDRPVSFIQNTENDTPYAAIPGKHYVPFNDPSVKPLMVVKANSNTANIPIILLRSSSLRDTSFRLKIEIAANESFALGDSRKKSRVLVFSDRLERFYSWRADNTTAPAFITFGKYSRGKHQFMIDILKTQIDEAWYQAVTAMQAATSYKNLLKKELNTFNADPANIAAGLAPLKESSDPASAVVTFP